MKLEGNINLGDKKFSALLGEALLAGDDDLVVLASDANLTFRVLDAEHLRVRHTLHLTTAQGRASAWMLDRSRKRLAIGTMTGQIALWNLGTNDVVWLQPHVSGWISMLGFSNDDSRLARGIERTERTARVRSAQRRTRRHAGRARQRRDAGRDERRGIRPRCLHRADSPLEHQRDGVAPARNPASRCARRSLRRR